MSKAPLKQLSVNTFERNRILPEKKNAPVTTDVSSVKKKKKTPVPVAQPSNDDIQFIVQAGSRMSTEEFQSMVQKTTPNSFWRVMAEFYRTKLDEVTRENQQLHEIVDGLNKDNEKLRAIADHCEHLTNILEKLTTDEPTDQTNRSSVRTRLFS